MVGWAESLNMGPLTFEVTDNVFERCFTPAVGETLVPVINRPRARGATGTVNVLIARNTIARSTSHALGGLDPFPPGTVIERNAVTGCAGGIDLTGTEDVTVSCNNVWGNGENWIGSPDLTGVSGNMSESPFYCSANAGNFTLAANSPMLPANNGCGVLIGALAQGCGPVSVTPASWGKIKSLFR